MINNRFVTIFDRAKNFHLVKDVGQIPYHMHKEHGYDSTIVTCKNDDTYSFLDNEVKGLKIKFIPKIKFFKINLGVIFYLIKNAKKIDILQQFHIRNYTIIYAIVYKIFNKNGINYIKADANEKYLVDRGRVIKKKYVNIISKYVDYLSFETKEITKLFKEQNNTLVNKVITIPNGVDEKYVKLLNLKNSCLEKENTIIYVARVGSYQKNTELFLDIIEKVNLKDWKVFIIGEIENEFKSKIDFFFQNNKQLVEKVIFLGNISSREEIYKYYAKSKVFCLTSRYEGFPLVFPEAIYFGNYIITTDVSGANDITNNEQFGVIVRNPTSENYAQILNNLITSEKLDSSFCKDIKTFAIENFTWQSIIKKLNRKLGKNDD